MCGPCEKWIFSVNNGLSTERERERDITRHAKEGRRDTIVSFGLLRTLETLVTILVVRSRLLVEESGCC